MWPERWLGAYSSQRMRAAKGWGSIHTICFPNQRQVLHRNASRSGGSEPTYTSRNTQMIYPDLCSTYQPLPMSVDILVLVMGTNSCSFFIEGRWKSRLDSLPKATLRSSTRPRRIICGSMSAHCSSSQCRLEVQCIS